MTTLFVTDEELAAELGVPIKEARAVLQEFDRDPTRGFPPKQKIWGNRRYMPAVRAYLDATVGLKIRDGAARVAPESRDNRSRLPRPPYPAAPLRRVNND